MIPTAQPCLLSSLFALTLLLLAGCGRRVENKPTTVTVAGAASMADVLRALDTLTGMAGPRVTVVSGASNVLARSLREGAPYDLFVSLDPQLVSALAHEGRVDSTTTIRVAANRLVVASTIIPDTIYSSLDFLRNLRRIVIASEGVPLRIYTEQALRRAHLWETLLPRFVYGSDARQVAEMVRNGDVDAGIIYATDVQQREVGVLYAVPPELHTPISIAAAATPNASLEVRKVLKLLESEDFRARLRTRGFDVGR